MKNMSADLSPEQWRFLSIVEVCGEPVFIDTVNELAPLPPSALLHLINYTSQFDWLSISDDHKIVLVPELPEQASQTLAQINSESRVEELLNQIRERKLDTGLGPMVMARLLSRSGQGFEAAQLEYELASTAFSERKYAAAEAHIKKTLSMLGKHLGNTNSDSLFILAVIDLARIQQRLKESLTSTHNLLDKARGIAKRLGDERNQAILTMYIGWSHINEADYSKGLSEIGDAMTIVGNLEDEDIRLQTSEFFGVFYFIQGLYTLANEYLEKALQAESLGFTLLLANNIPMFAAYSAIITGKIQRAVGVLDSRWHRARLDGEKELATYYRCSLAIMLILWREKAKALPHIQTGLTEAEEQNNHWALGEALAAMAHYHYIEDNMQEAYEWTVKCLSRTPNLPPFGRKPIWPQTIEMFFEFEELGYDPLPYYDCREMMKSYLEGVNVHQRGLALYIQAKHSLMKKTSKSEAIRDLLERSETDLKQSGDLISLAKNHVELAKLYYLNGDFHKARKIALQAWETMSGYGHSYYPHGFFPESLKPLLGTNSLSLTPNRQDELKDRFLDLIEEAFPIHDSETVLQKLIFATSRFFEAERGGVFLIKGDQPVFHAGYNMTNKEVKSKDFHFNLEQINKVAKNNQPLILKLDQSRSVLSHPAIVCIPFEYSGKTTAVLYHDNSYIGTNLDSIDRTLLVRLSRHLSSMSGKIGEYTRMLIKHTAVHNEDLSPSSEIEEHQMKVESPLMKELIARARQVADSDASVLILGETGVGKELLARSIHTMSSRRSGPFIVVDLTSVPETLVESELFGHEKGAFTGADHLKKGRMELAHKGTIFIDEVGDIPKSAQTKLLRSLQEKAFARVGGTRTITSDFRLVAATNRDLAKEVADSNFREDLYYRLNVVPLTIPPLRERGTEIISLAMHFLDLYAKKYRRPRLTLTGEDKTRLLAYTWPGNVRELKNVIERAVIMSNAQKPQLILPMDTQVKSDNPFAQRPTLDELQRQYILYILHQTGGKISGPDGAAKIMGMKRTTLYTRMRRLGLE